MKKHINPEGLWEQHYHSKIIQIYGKAGSGKSTLAMHFVGYILQQDIKNKAFWVDAERKTTSKRLNDIIGNNARSILIAQPRTYDEQEKVFKSLSTMEFPITVIVIDTISHHFRELEKRDSWTSYSDYLQFFYEIHILPLLITQRWMNCHLILVHQITSLPEEEDKPYLYKVFEEIHSDWIHLEKGFES
ncbi:MAG: AAA family ATPase [Candidatus Lokiarchaeota archaeon]|nr:AAA family ATPase [Candidatus Lokiarchaeota archaeon]